MIDENCIFCKIVAGKIPSEKVLQDELVTAFRDINPVAPVHILIVPNMHVASINDLNLKDQSSAARLLGRACPSSTPSAVKPPASAAYRAARARLWKPAT